MRAIVLYGHGERDQLVYELDYPDPQPGPHDVLLRVGATSVNYHDIFTRRGMPGIKIDFPLIAGCDLAGAIVKTGEEVAAWSPGDRVLVDPIRIEEGVYKLVGETTNGGRAELVTVHASSLIRLPDSLGYEAAACLPTAYATAYRMMSTRGAVDTGDTVLVLGASGGVGTACVLLAKQVGAEVIACTTSATKAEQLCALGADHVIDYTTHDLRSEIYRLCGKPRIVGGGGVSVVVNFTGGDTWVPSLHCLRKGGRLLTCGATAGFSPRTDLRYIWSFEQTILGSDSWTRNELESIVAMARMGCLEPVIGVVLPLNEAAEAERLLEDREIIGKIVLVP